MKLRNTIQQMEAAIQLPLFEGQDNDLASSSPIVLQDLIPEIPVSTESKEAYERRRVTEMAEKLGWRSMSREEPLRCWPVISIPEGEIAWRAFLERAASGTIGLMLLALHSLLNPCYLGEINESTGLHQHPVEVISRVEERCRSRMIQLAEFLGWPRISYWAANRTQVIGPGETEWRKYFVYGCAGLVADAVGALERRVRGEPDQVRRASRQSYNDEED
jgi:hypothetical protein